MIRRMPDDPRPICRMASSYETRSPIFALTEPGCRCEPSSSPRI